MSMTTSIQIEISQEEANTLEDIIATLQYVDPDMSVDDCLKWLFTQGCNKFIAEAQKLGYGEVKA
jgi:hypothetical protein